MHLLRVTRDYEVDNDDKLIPIIATNSVAFCKWFAIRMEKDTIKAYETPRREPPLHLVILY
jgi:hypothetical protein